MKDTDYNIINPILRIKENELISDRDFSIMLATESLRSFVDVLRTTAYGSYISRDNEMEFIDNFEYYLREDRKKVFDWLYSIVPDKGPVDLFTLRYTYHNLKVLTKGEFLGKDLDHFLVDDRRYSFKTLKSAVFHLESTELPPIILESIREVKEELKQYEDVQGISVIYDCYCLKHRMILARELGIPELFKEETTYIDLTNISFMARGILQKQSPSVLSTVLSEDGSIPKDKLLKYAGSSDLEPFKSYIYTTVYKDIFYSITDEKSKWINLRTLNVAKDNYITKSYQSAKLRAFGPLLLLSYLNAKEVEWKNLRLLIVGKKNNFSQKILKERIRESYVS